MICDGVDATTGVGSCLVGSTSAAATVIIVLGGLIGLFFGLWQFFQVRNIDLPDGKDPNATKHLRDEANNPQPDESTGLTGPVAAGKEDEVLDSHFEKLVEIYGYVRTGAESFLMAQYSLCLMFTVVFSIIVLVLCSSVNNARGYDKLTVTPIPDAMNSEKVTITYTGPSAGCSVTEVDRGTHESSECSGRGNCDYSTGTCLCDAGYTLEACSEQTVLV